MNLEISEKPAHGTPVGVFKGVPIPLGTAYQDFFDALEQNLNTFFFGGATYLPTYAKADLPAAADLPDSTLRWMIFVSDDVGGSTPAFWDGTNWRRTSDRAVIA